MCHSVLSYSMTTLLRQTGPLSKKYVNGCSYVKFRTDSKRGRWLYKVRSNKPDSKGPYIVRVSLEDLESDKPSRLQDVKVSCTCDFFWYYGGVYNAMKDDFLDGKSPRGRRPQAPTVNKKHNVKVCKHIASVFPSVKARIDYYLRTGDFK